MEGGDIQSGSNTDKNAVIETYIHTGRQSERLKYIHTCIHTVRQAYKD